MKRRLSNVLKRTLCCIMAMGMVGQGTLPAYAEETGNSARLIAYYDFEDASGTNVPNKVNAERYAGTLNGGGAKITEEGDLGKSLNFDGSAASWMQIDEIINASTTSYSFSMWYKYDTSVSRSENMRVVLLQQNGGGRTLLTLQSDNTYHTYVNTADVNGTVVVNPEEWQHVTFVSNADTKEVTWYVNGEKDSTQSGGSAPVNELTDLLVGCHKNGLDNPMYMRGLVDEIKIYEGIVTAEEAKAIYEEKAALVREEQKDPDDGKTETIVYTVDPEVIERTVDESIFGINHRYAFNGYGSFDSETMKVKDEFRALYEEAGFGSIRYPGGTISNLFNWKTTLDAVGRKKQIHGFYNNAGQGGIEPNFGIKEIADFADEVNSEIVYVYGIGKGNAQDAADLIEYLNAEVGTNPNGGIDWAKVRSDNGHPEPYDVRYFEIGNETNQVYEDGTSSQAYWLHGVSNAETGYIEGGTATFTDQYAVCEEDWNQQASKSDGSANMVRYMRYANVNPKKYDENGKIVNDDDFEAVVTNSVSVKVGDQSWTIVKSFENSSAQDQHVVVDYSTGALLFGDGVHGAIPTSGQQIYVSYSVKRDGFVEISKAIKETTEKINQANKENGIEKEQNAFVYSSYETSGFITKMAAGGYDQWYDGLTIHPYSGTPNGTGAEFYDSAMSLAESAGIQKVENYVNMLPKGKVPVISEYGIFRSTDSLVRSQTHAIYIAKVLMEYVRLGSPYIQKHCLIDWYSTGADSLGPTQQAVIQAVAQEGANTKTGEGKFAFFATPSARVFQMLNSSFGTEILEGSFDDTETIRSAINGKNYAYKAYSALASRDAEDNYYAAFVNTDKENAKSVEFKVKDMDLTGRDVEIQILTSDSYADENTLENPDHVAVLKTSVTNEGSSVKFELPKHSFAVVKVLAEKPMVEGVTRLAGKTRYETSRAIADELRVLNSGEKFDTVLIATGIDGAKKDKFADALSGSYLAALVNAPILLTNSSNADEVSKLYAYINENVKDKGTIYILGGSGVVSSAVETELNSEGYQVERLSGSDRYATNIAILKKAIELGGSKDELIVATGLNFADSLSASAVKKPILLVNGGNQKTGDEGRLTDVQKTFVEANYKAAKTYIVGGAGAVSEKIEDELETILSSDAERISGTTRYETSVKVAETFFEDAEYAVVATGVKFPDGLCGGPLAAALNAPLILTKDGNSAATAYAKAENITSGYVLGGTGAVADTVAKDIFSAESIDVE